MHRLLNITNLFLFLTSPKALDVMRKRSGSGGVGGGGGGGGAGVGWQLEKSL